MGSAGGRSTGDTGVAGDVRVGKHPLPVCGRLGGGRVRESVKAAGEGGDVAGRKLRRRQGQGVDPVSSTPSQPRNQWRPCQALDRLGDPSMVAF